jgi:hypothetical protein
MEIYGAAVTHGLDGIVTKLNDNATKTGKLSDDLHALSKKIAYGAGAVTVALAAVGFEFCTGVNFAISFAKDAMHNGAQPSWVVVQSSPPIPQPQPIVPKGPDNTKP